VLDILKQTVNDDFIPRQDSYTAKICVFTFAILESRSFAAFHFNWAFSEYSTNILKDFMHKKPVLHQLLTFNYSNHIGFKDGMKYI